MAINDSHNMAALAQAVINHLTDAEQRGIAVAYGSPAVRRRGLLARLFTWLKTPVMVTLVFFVSPLACVTSWLLFPLWFGWLHEIAWGPMDPVDMSVLAVALHIMALFAWVVVVVGTLALRLSGPEGQIGYWWWSPPPAKKD